MSQPPLPPAQDAEPIYGGPQVVLPPIVDRSSAADLPPAKPPYGPQSIGAPPPPPALAVAPAALSPFMSTPRAPALPPLPRTERPLFWRIVRWPFKTLLKGIYYAGNGVSQHPRRSLGVAAVLAVLVLALWVIVNMVTPTARPARALGSVPIATASPNPDINAPFTITDYTQGLAPLPTNVLHYLHGLKTYNAQELWSALSPTLQQTFTQNNITQSAYASYFVQEKTAGIAYQQFIYTGYFIVPGTGVSKYTVEVIKSDSAGNNVAETFYFEVDGQGQVIQASNLNGQ